MTHKLLEVINVGQGDCLILRPDNCKYSRQAFIIDTGNGIADFTKRLDNDEEYHVLLTHSHNDHVNGFNLLLGSEIVNMQSLILPYYHNESILIVQALLNLKGMASLSDRWGLKWQLNRIIANQRILVNLGEKIKIQFVGDGDNLCCHMHILNPPLIWQEHFDKIYNDDDIYKLTELFEEKFASSLYTYLKMARRNNSIADAPHITELLLKEYDREDLHNRSNFVLEFLLENIELMRSFNEHSKSIELLKLLKNKELKDHQACVVMRCEYKNRWFLFGGDADKSVWNRLISERKDISAYYLKVPHHGSKHNINQLILKRVNPKIAIISHNNGLFGKAKDPHPNIEVINLIQKEGIKLISTNDIRKKGNVIWTYRRDNEKDNYVDVVEI